MESSPPTRVEIRVGGVSSEKPLRRGSRARWSKPSVCNRITGRLLSYVLAAACCGLIFREMIFVPYPLADGSHPYRADATLGPSVISGLTDLPTADVIVALFSSPQMAVQIVPTLITVALTRVFGSPAGWNTAIVLMSMANYHAAEKLARAFFLRKLHCSLIALTFAFSPTLVVFIGGPTLSLLLAPTIHLLREIFARTDSRKWRTGFLICLSLICSDVSATIAVLTLLFLSFERIVGRPQRNFSTKVLEITIVLVSITLLGAGLRTILPAAFQDRTWASWLFFGADLRALWLPLANSPGDRMARLFGYNIASSGFLSTPWQHFSPGIFLVIALVAHRVSNSRWFRGFRYRELDMPTDQSPRAENFALFIFACLVVPFGGPNNPIHVLWPSFWSWTAFPVMRYTGRGLPVVYLFTLVVLLGHFATYQRRLMAQVVTSLLVLLATANVVTTPMRVGAINYDQILRWGQAEVGQGEIYVVSFNVRAETLRWHPNGSQYVGITEHLRPELKFASYDFHRAIQKHFDVGCESVATALQFTYWDNFLVERTAGIRENCRGEEIHLKQADELIELELYRRGSTPATKQLAGLAAEDISQTALRNFVPFVTLRETDESTQTFFLNRFVDPSGNEELPAVAHIQIKRSHGQLTSSDFICLRSRTGGLIAAGRLTVGEHKWVIPEGCQILRFMGVDSDLRVSVDPFLHFATVDLTHNSTLDTAKIQKQSL